VDLKTDQEAVHAEKQAFPDLRISVQDIFAEGDKVAVLWHFEEHAPAPVMKVSHPLEQEWKFLASPFGGSCRSGPVSVKRKPTSERLPPEINIPIP
jgi:hypothetical protein